MKKKKRNIFIYPEKITEVFDGADFHIKYCLSFIKRYLYGDILEVGAGCGSFTRHYMNEKILPDDIELKSLSELTDIADRLVQKLENKKNLEESIEDYQYLIKLNNIIEKKFQKDSKNISESTKLKIEELTLKKNEKKIS